MALNGKHGLPTKSGYKVKHWRGVPIPLVLEAAPVIEFVIWVGLGDSFEKQLTLSPFALQGTSDQGMVERDETASLV